MFVLPTAKTLLFIALSVGPHNAPTIYATSKSENYIWNSSPTGGWNIEALGFPQSDFTRDRTKVATVTGDPLHDSAVPPYLRAVAHHDWSHDSAMVFENGDRVEKSGDHAFYIINAGGANEKVFTFLYPTNKS
jgi:hypothetical protein